MKSSIFSVVLVYWKLILWRMSYKSRHEPPAHKVEEWHLPMVWKLRAEMSFSAWSEIPCTPSAKRKMGGYMRISTSIHDVAGQGRNPLENRKDVP
jgi:hypothetical protein